MTITLAQGRGERMERLRELSRRGARALEAQTSKLAPAAVSAPGWKQVAGGTSGNEAA